MLRRLLLASCCCLLTCGAVRAADSLPYTGRVIQDNVPLRSGPSGQHYVTDFVNQGYELQVYQLTDDGWLAIRPPDGSYSWVPAEQVRMTDQLHVAECQAEGAEVLVGSQHVELEQLESQVRLHQGERLQVLGQQRRGGASPGGGKVWFKIAPPAGEFRWIRANLVNPVERVGAGQGGPPQGSAPDAAESPEGAAAGRTGFREVGSNNVRYDAVSESSGAHPLVFRKPVASTSSPAAAAHVPSRSAAPNSGNRQTVAAGLAGADEPSPRIAEPEVDHHLATQATAASHAAEVGSALDDLDLQLSLIVARPDEEWQLDELRVRAEELLQRGATPLERGRAKLLLARIDEFIALQTQSRELSESTPPSVRQVSATEDARITSAAIGSGVQEIEEDQVGYYDASGWLLPVYSTRATTPPYAVTDNQRNVLYYVSPAPGLNLHRYLRKEVGIFGQRNYLPHLKTPHVTAQRVVDLQRHQAFSAAYRSGE